MSYIISLFPIALPSRKETPLFVEQNTKYERSQSWYGGNNKEGIPALNGNRASSYSVSITINSSRLICFITRKENIYLKYGNKNYVTNLENYSISFTCSKSVILNVNEIS
jgi:hypothetical protein